MKQSLKKENIHLIKCLTVNMLHTHNNKIHKLSNTLVDKQANAF